VANIYRQIAEELGVREQQVEATVGLLDGGATVPFVARYRKEITGSLDDAQLRTLEERLNYLRELEERRIAVLNSIREQGKLDAALEAAILAAGIFDPSLTAAQSQYIHPYIMYASAHA